MTDFPSQYARTRRFSLGQPRGFTVASDGSRVLFLRSRSGVDPLTSLYVYDVAAATEWMLADAGEVSLGASDLAEAELRRRERVRELSTGIVAYSCDPLARTAVFLLDGAVFTADVASGAVRRVPTRDGPSDARPNASGTHVAYVSDGRLSVVSPDGGEVLRVGDEGDGPHVTWGLAEFVAAEEMGRTEGYWWCPDGRRLAVARVDTSAVATTSLLDASDPRARPLELRYPFAGTANAEVGLLVVGFEGAPVLVVWDWVEFPYLVRVVWHGEDELTLLVQSRDQRQMQVLTADPATGASQVRRETEDERWNEIVPGVPAWTPDGRLVTAGWAGDAMAVFVEDEPVTPPGVQVREVVRAGDELLFTASTEPTEVHVWRGAQAITHRPGVHSVAAGGDVLVITSSTAESFDAQTAVLKDGRPVGTIGATVEAPGVRARPQFVALGARALRAAVFVPTGEPPWPVLLDPYGGPHHQKVLRARRRLAESAWFADEGFAVVVADGRGTGGRGREWDQAIHLNLADVVLEDQVDALLAAAVRHPELDLTRVAIRGSSFGGYLAALAVLRRPDVFHAAIAIAPVTEWRFYDTHYTERYLGDPNERSEVYDRNSLLPGAAKVERPLLLVHGLADDNVLPANTLRLSAELVGGGRRHELVMLPGASHVMSRDEITARVLTMELEFLRSSLGVGG